LNQSKSEAELNKIVSFFKVVTKMVTVLVFQTGLT